MPKLKKSLGRIKIQTPIGDHFSRYFWHELENAREWNEDLITRVGSTSIHSYWRFDSKLWRIDFDNNTLTVISDEPVVHIRKGLRINMGHGRIEIE